MSKPKVLITRRWPEAIEKAMSGSFNVTLNTDDTAMTAQELANALQEFDAICPSVTDSMPEAMFEAESFKTRIIGNYGVGFNHIAVDAAKAKGLVVTNTPDVLTDATADLAMTLMLMLARRAGEGERQVRAGEWHGWYPTHLMGTQLQARPWG